MGAKELNLPIETYEKLVEEENIRVKAELDR
jgi:hypothetical protein